MMINKVFFDGFLGHDVEVKTSSNGTDYVHLSLANNRRVPDGDGGFTDETVWARLTAFGALARSLASLGTGSRVIVTARLKTTVFKKGDVEFQYAELIAEDVSFVSVKKRPGAGDDAPEAAAEAAA